MSEYVTLEDLIVQMGKSVGTTYKMLNQSEQAQIDGYCEQMEAQAEKQEGRCVCGEFDCPDEYVHNTSGW